MNKKTRLHLTASMLIGVIGISSSSNIRAEETLSMKKAVEVAILTNPEILQAYKNYESVVNDREAAFGRYLPSVDFTTSAGAEDRHDPLVVANNNRYFRSQNSLSLKQVIFDGFATKNEVARLDHTSKARLYELENMSQYIASEVSRSYIDLVRYKTLKGLAESNYISHKIIFRQILIKAKAGVGKSSDADQALSRLYLATYNLSVESSNLHDAEVRYQRLTGQLPPKEIDKNIPIMKDIPKDSVAAIKQAQLHNPSLLATIEDTLSQRALVDNKGAAFMPKVEFRARADRGEDLNGYAGSHRNDVAEVVVSWNIFNGFTDINLKRKEQSLFEASVDRRDKTCRDIRLEVELAYNDINKLTKQSTFLDTRIISTEKTRDAYRKQFEIGQRTLVDLLNAENELFDAKRLYTNVSSEMLIANVRTHYQMGSLLNILGLTRYANKEAPLQQLASNDGANIAACPAEAVAEVTTNSDYIDNSNMEILLPPKTTLPNR